jgi:hypothetical protein
LPIDAEKIVEFRLKLLIDPKHNLFSEIDMDAYLMRDLTGVVVDYDFYMNEENNLNQYLENDPDAVLSRISHTLCKPFRVSTVVIETRVKREGLWPPK